MEARSPRRNGAGTLSAGGNLTLAASSTLALTLGAGIKVNNTYFVVLNDGLDRVAGGFDGLADDSTFTAGRYRFQIGCDANSATGLPSGGNDIVLVA